MADCDLCGVSIPTVVPVRAFAPRFEHSYPEGIWKGLCEQCLKRQKRPLTGQQHPLMRYAGKCDLCGAIAQLQPVEISRPSFQKAGRGYGHALQEVPCFCAGSRQELAKTESRRTS